MKKTLALLALAVAGCQDGPKVVAPESPSRSGALHQDLPAPPGFVYVENLTDTSPTAAFRVVNQVLEGRNQRVAGAVKFYKEAFPVHGWTLQSEEGDLRDAVRLSFVKKDERCVVDVKDASQTLVRSTLRVSRKE